jgi:hypothetical protein
MAFWSNNSEAQKHAEQYAVKPSNDLETRVARLETRLMMIDKKVGMDTTTAIPSCLLDMSPSFGTIVLLLLDHLNLKVKYNRPVHTPSGFTLVQKEEKSNG